MLCGSESAAGALTEHGEHAEIGERRDLALTCVLRVLSALSAFVICTYPHGLHPTRRATLPQTDICHPARCRSSPRRAPCATWLAGTTNSGSVTSLRLNFV